VKFIDKIVKQKKEGNTKMVMVSYVGWPEKLDEWISEADYKAWVKFKKDL
jgi:hypothetical protein